MVLSRNLLNPVVLPLAGIAGVLLALCIGLGVRLDSGVPPGLPSPPLAPLLGQPAPPFQVEGVNGALVSLQSAPSAAAWLLFVTDSTCGACQAAYPSLEQAATRLPVVVVGVGDQRPLDPRLVQVAMAVGYDRLGTVQQRYRVRHLPSVFLIDPQGIVRHAASGGESVEQVLSAWEAHGSGGL